MTHGTQGAKSRRTPAHVTHRISSDAVGLVESLTRRGGGAIQVRHPGDYERMAEPSMRTPVPEGEALVTCWCERKVKALPLEFIRQGMTWSCGRTGCRENP